MAALNVLMVLGRALATRALVLGRLNVYTFLGSKTMNKQYTGLRKCILI